MAVTVTNTSHLMRSDRDPSVYCLEGSRPWSGLQIGQASIVPYLLVGGPFPCTLFGAHLEMANSTTYCLRHYRLLYPNSFSCSLLSSVCRRFHSKFSFQNTPEITQQLRSSVGPAWRSTTLETGSKRPLSMLALKTQRQPSINLSTLRRACYMTRYVPGSAPFLPFASLHSRSMLMAPAEGGKDTKPKSKTSETHGSVLMGMIKSQEQQPKQLTVGGKVVQAGKDFTYLIVIFAGFAIAGFLFWSVGSEFFSQNSPSVVYSKALKRVKSDPRVIEVLGEPISGHGAPSGRGRRRDVVHQEYIVDGEKYMRVQFYVDGSKRKGTVQIDLKKNERGKYDCRFLFVELKGHPQATIVLEDNR